MSAAPPYIPPKSTIPSPELAMVKGRKICGCKCKGPTMSTIIHRKLQKTEEIICELRKENKLLRNENKDRKSIIQDLQGEINIAYAKMRKLDNIRLAIV